MFASERQNVIKACDIVRHSPLIGPKIPAHGLLMDIETGNLEWIVNGYQALEMAANQLSGPAKAIGQMTDALGAFDNFNIGEMKFPEGKIGELATKTEDWLSQKAKQIETKLKLTPPVAPMLEKSPKIPIPPPIRPRPTFPTKRR
jgi:carbonic anhydrase